jgi:hypothetical protein
MDTEHVAVEINVAGIERVQACGSLVALAIVELRINDVDITLQGVQIRRTANNKFLCQSPQFRDPRSGRWLPCILLPPELSAAIGAEVTDGMMQEIASVGDGTKPANTAMEAAR